MIFYLNWKSKMYKSKINRFVTSHFSTLYLPPCCFDSTQWMSSLTVFEIDSLVGCKFTWSCVYKIEVHVCTNFILFVWKLLHLKNKSKITQIVIISKLRSQYSFVVLSLKCRTNERARARTIQASRVPDFRYARNALWDYYKGKVSPKWAKT